MFVKYIQQETGTRVQIKGQGSGFVDQETGKESEEPMHIHITCVLSLGVSSCFDSLPSGPEEGQVARAKALTDDLLEVVRGEYEKVKGMLHQQQMELHQAQMQYASYGMMAVRILYTGCSSTRLHALIFPIRLPFLGLRPPSSVSGATATTARRTTTATAFRWGYDRPRNCPCCASSN